MATETPCRPHPQPHRRATHPPTHQPTSLLGVRVSTSWVLAKFWGSRDTSLVNQMPAPMPARLVGECVGAVRGDVGAGGSAGCFSACLPVPVCIAAALSQLQQQTVSHRNALTKDEGASNESFGEVAKPAAAGALAAAAAATVLRRKPRRRR